MPDLLSSLEALFQKKDKAFFVAEAIIPKDGESIKGFGILRIARNTFVLEFTPETDEQEEITGEEPINIVEGYSETNTEESARIALLYNGYYIYLDATSLTRPHKQSFQSDLAGNRLGKTVSEYSFSQIKSRKIQGEEIEGITTIIASLHHFRLKTINTVTNVTIERPLKKITANVRNVFQGTTENWDYTLTYSKPHTVVQLVSKKPMPVNPSGEIQTLHDFLAAVALHHGQNAWPYLIRRYKGKNLREFQFNKTKTKRSFRGPYSLGVRTEIPLEETLEKGFQFFQQHTPLSEEASLLLYWLRESQHVAGTITVCALLETLIKAIYEDRVYQNESQANKDKYDGVPGTFRPPIESIFKKTVRELQLNWTDWKPIFDKWYILRNQLVHRGTKSTNPNGEVLHNEDTTITQAIYTLIFRLIGVE